MSLLPLPEGELIYEYFFDLSSNKWPLWEASLKPQQIEEGTPFHEITVQTVDTARNDYWLGAMINHGYHLLLTGASWPDALGLLGFFLVFRFFFRFLFRCRWWNIYFFLFWPPLFTPQVHPGPLLFLRAVSKSTFF